MRVHPPQLRRLLPGMLGLALSAGAAASLANPAQAVEPSGAKAAQVYCFMRSNGNNHEVSWAAAYGVVKQTTGVFKPPPERAAVMITEAVVDNPASYPDCARYLGDLYSRRVYGGAVGAPDSTGAPGAPTVATTPGTAMPYPR
ncbi:MAG: penicillin amidase [Cyanobacteria bacterium]|nr:penicillin amidase [Cyanobacteriota bacterium]